MIDERNELHAQGKESIHLPKLVAGTITVFNPKQLLANDPTNQAKEKSCINPSLDQLKLKN